MSNCVFGYPFWSDPTANVAASLRGGSWLAALPRANMQDPRLEVVARSTDATRDSTWAEADLIAAQYVGVLALVAHTCSLTARLRWRGCSAPTAFAWLSVGDTGWAAVGTPTRTAEGFTRSNGVPLDLIGDDTAGQKEGYTRSATFTGNAVKLIRFTIAKSSSYASHAVLLVDTTAVATRLAVNIDFTAAVPVVTASTGTVLSTTANGDGSFTVIVNPTNITAANVNQVQVTPANGSILDMAALYIGDFLAFDATTDQLMYDGGLNPVYPVVYPPGVLPASDPRNATGKYTADVAARIRVNPALCPSPFQLARYWRMDIDDTTNAAGYVDVGRFIVAYPYQPSMNLVYGAKLGLSTATTFTEMDGGARRFNARPNRQEQVFTIDDNTTDESLVQMLDMVKQLGVNGQLFFVFDAADTYHMHRRSMLCTLKELSPMEYAYFDGQATPFALTEVL
jgi:hypothetical protein